GLAAEVVKASGQLLRDQRIAPDRRPSDEQLAWAGDAHQRFGLDARQRAVASLHGLDTLSAGSGIGMELSDGTGERLEEFLASRRIVTVAGIATEAAWAVFGRTPSVSSASTFCGPRGRMGRRRWHSGSSTCTPRHRRGRDRPPACVAIGLCV